MAKSAPKTNVVPIKEKPIRRRLYMRTPAGERLETFIEVRHTEDPRAALMKKIGVIPDGVVQFARLLVAVYVAPAVNTTAGGLILTDRMKDTDLQEFLWQGKVGLIVAKGDRAYKDDDNIQFHGIENHVGDWVWFRPSDAMQCEVNEVFCRVLRETDIIGKIPHPDYVW